MTNELEKPESKASNPDGTESPEDAMTIQFSDEYIFISISGPTGIVQLNYDGVANLANGLVDWLDEQRPDLAETTQPKPPFDS